MKPKNTYNFYNKKSKELKDQEIIDAIQDALYDYKDGAIIECRETLARVIDSIDTFIAVERIRS